MAIKSVFLADQLKAIIQAEGLASELSAPGFEEVRSILSTHTRFKPEAWIARMRTTAAVAREAWEDREKYEREWRTENTEVRDLIEAGNAWRGEAADAIKLALAMRVPAAKQAARLLAGVGLTVESYEHQRMEIGSFVKTLATLDLEALDITQEFLQEGRDIAAGLSKERSDADQSKGNRAAETDELGRALLEVADLAEELDAARKLAERRSGRELPGYDLTYIRAAAAAHRSPEEEPAKDGEEDGGDDAGDQGL